MQRVHIVGAGVSVVFIILAIGLNVARAAFDNSITPELNNFAGAAVETVSIEVPSFRGIEPRLALRYHSGSLNGWVGMGWNLSGISAIERRSSRGGMPVYDASWSRYYLDGELLIDCTKLGGTHCTQRQSYVRIRFDTVADSWTLTASDGTETVYAPVFQTNRGTFRWLPVTVTDTHGNAVEYSYYCDGAPAVECYPQTIRYNQTELRFHREARPDPVRFVTGDEAAYGNTRYRLKTIDVNVSGYRLHAYRLVYTTSQATSRSLLQSVQKFGKDAVLDAMGTVIGGTAFPATSFAYSASDITNPFSAPVPWSHASNYTGWDAHTGDFNGDGKTDLLLSNTDASGWSVRAALSAGDGTFSTATTRMEAGDYASSWQLGIGDFDGNGRSDLALYKLDATGWHLKVALSNGDGSFATSVDYLPLAAGDYTGYSADFGDRHGEGTTDFWVQKVDVDGMIIKYALSNLSGSVLSVGAPQVYRNQTGSFEGCRANVGDYLGWGTESGYTRGCGWDWNRWSKHRADVNQDGGDDSLYVSLSSSGWASRTWVFTACTANPSGTCSFVSTEPILWSVPGNYAGWGRAVGDFDGDKTADLVAFSAGSTQFRAEVALAVGDATYRAPVTYNGSGNYVGWHVLVADFDGDGRDDLGWVSVGSSLQVRVAHSSAGKPGKLVSVRNRNGGTKTIAYQPSSAWPSTYLPPGHVFDTVSAITLDDGRGAPVTRTYEYEGARWSDEHRRLLGFRTIRSIDATGAYRETQFTQHVADPQDTIDAVYKRSSDGTAYTEQIYERDRSGTGAAGSPFVSQQSASWHYECNADATCKRSSEASVYDRYGNRIRHYQYGDYDVTGDELSTITSFYPNQTRFITDRPAIVRMRAGIGTRGKKLAVSRTYYDGQSLKARPQFGDPTKRSDWLKGRNYVTAWTAEYDVYGNRTATADALGNRTVTSYDGTFNLLPVEVRDPLYPTDNRHKTVLTWDTACAAKTSVTDANEQTTSIIYDALCRPSQVSYPDGGAKLFAYVALGSPTAQYTQTAITDGTADHWWRRSYFDGLGRTYKTLAEPDIARQTAYDSRGHVWKESLPYYEGATPRYREFSYDPIGRVTRVAMPDGAHVDKEYGDWTVQRRDELGITTQHYVDGYGRHSHTWEQLGGTSYVTTVERDLLGRLTRVTDAAGNNTTVTYDNLGRAVAMHDPDLGASTYTYNDAGWMTSRRDAENQRIDLVYDALGRVIEKRHGAATFATFRYDEARADYFNVGHLTTMVDASTSASGTEFNYDPRGRLAHGIRDIQGTEYPVSWSYDVAGRLENLTYPGSETVTYEYDAAGRPFSAQPYVTEAYYNAAGEPLYLSLGNGVVEESEYDPDRSWLARQVTRRGATVLDDAAYARNARGDIVARYNALDELDRWSYEYDDLGRLIRADNLGQPSWSEEFAFDIIGNLTWQSSLGTYAYPPAGQARPHAPISAGSFEFTYDANGNRVSDGIKTYEYDVENHPVVVGEQTYLYDGAGQRVKAGATALVGKLYEQTGASWRRYVHFGDRRVARRDETGSVHYYHADNLGTAHRLTGESGTQTARQAFSPFGRQLAATGVPDPFGLAGERLDQTGLYHLSARYMDPMLGQFITPDPSNAPDPAWPQTLNRYAYALNNPVMFADPTGFAATSKDKKQAARDKKASGKSKNTGKESDKGTSTAKKAKVVAAKKAGKKSGLIQTQSPPGPEQNPFAPGVPLPSEDSFDDRTLQRLQQDSFRRSQGLPPLTDEEWEAITESEPRDPEEILEEWQRQEMQEEWRRGQGWNDLDPAQPQPPPRGSMAMPGHPDPNMQDTWGYSPPNLDI